MNIYQPSCGNCGKQAFYDHNKKLYSEFCSPSCRDHRNGSRPISTNQPSAYIKQQATQGEILCGIPGCPNAAYRGSLGCGKTHLAECHARGIRSNR